MKQAVNLHDFRREFQLTRPENFSYEGLEVLFDFLEEIYEETGEEYELDVIALCCDYVESTVGEALKEYGLKSLEELEENTTVLKVDDKTIIYRTY